MALNRLDTRRAAPAPKAPEPREESQVSQVAGRERTFARGKLDVDSFLADRPSFRGPSLADAERSLAPANRLARGGDFDVFTSGPKLDVDVDADADVSLKGVDLELEVDIDATLAEAGARGSRTIEVDVAGEKYEVALNFEALGKIGADGKLLLDVHIGTNGKAHVTAWAEGFAGARASLSGSIEVRHEGDFLVGGQLEAAAVAGVSGKAYLDMGVRNGNVYFEAGAEATAGAGFGVEVRGEANMRNVLEAAGETALAAAGEGIGSVFDNLGDGLSGLWKRRPAFLF